MYEMRTLSVLEMEKAPHSHEHKKKKKKKQCQAHYNIINSFIYTRFSLYNN